MFTPGSMSIQPQHSVERCFVIGALFFGLVIFSSFISSVTAAVAQLKAKSADHSRDLWLLRRYLRQRGVVYNLAFRILRHVEYALQQEGRNDVISANKVCALTFLSAQLRWELAYAVQFPCVCVHPLLRHLASVSTKAMKHELAKTALSERSLAPADVLIEMGTIATHMHIIVGGSLVYISAERDENAADIRLRSDDWLCEPVLWTDWFHRGDATAHSELELVSIEAVAFLAAIKGMQCTPM